MNQTKIISSWSGHDAAFCVTKDAQIELHCELERFIREKEPQGDAIQFLFEQYENCKDIKHYAAIHPLVKSTRYKESWNKMINLVQQNNGQTHLLGHHLCHASNAYYSSNFDESIIITLDGGGIEDSHGFSTACAIWLGKKNKIKSIEIFSSDEVNYGGLFTRVTRYIHLLNSGWPGGSQHGTVMALAAYGDPQRFKKDFLNMFTHDLLQASWKPPTQPKGDIDLPNEVKHPYLDKWAQIARKSFQDEADLAAGLQSALEDMIRQMIDHSISKNPGVRNICFSGGVSLNCVSMGKVYDWFPEFENNIYITATPHDGGLPIGACQYIWHHRLDNPKVVRNKNLMPYLGIRYKKEDVYKSIESFKDKIVVQPALDQDVIELLAQQKIIALFDGAAESGRRALLHRSIICDPRNKETKNRLNSVIKERKWFRPLCPSILREHVRDYFEYDIDSPFMSIAIRFKPEVRELLAPVVHKDGTGRLQTVTKEDNEWAHNFLTLWHQKSGIPILLNTSYNVKSPITENMNHAIETLLKTQLDYLYLPEHKILVYKK